MMLGEIAIDALLYFVLFNCTIVKLDCTDYLPVH